MLTRVRLASVIFLGLLGVVVLVGVNADLMECSTRRSVAQLVADAATFRGTTLGYEVLEGLPEPVQRYFRTVLKDGQPYIRVVRLNQRGEFRMREDTDQWFSFQAEQVFTTDPPGFVWDATIRMAPFMSVRVVDRYHRGVGVMRVKLLHTLTLVDESAKEELDSGALIRYFAEAVWLTSTTSCLGSPTCFLALFLIDTPGRRVIVSGSRLNRRRRERLYETCFSH